MDCTKICTYLLVQDHLKNYSIYLSEAGPQIHVCITQGYIYINTYGIYLEIDIHIYIFAAAAARAASMASGGGYGGYGGYGCYGGFGGYRYYASCT